MDDYTAAPVPVGREPIPPEHGWDARGEAAPPEAGAGDARSGREGQDPDTAGPDADGGDGSPKTGEGT